MEVFAFFADYEGQGGRIAELLARIPVAMVPDRVVLAWEAGGLLSPGWSPQKTLTRTWLNVVAHQVAVAWTAYQLSDGDPVLTEAALVHDAYKRREWEADERAKQEGVERGEANRQAEVDSGSFLTNLGFDPEVVTVAQTTSDLGLDRIVSGDADLRAKLMHYADDCVSGDQIVGYKQRFDDLLPQFQPGGRYEWANDAFQKKYGMTHRETFDSVVLPLETELAERLHYKGDPSTLYTLAL